MIETPREVQYYCHIEEELLHSRKHKAMKFVENKCIEFNKEQNFFVCKPLIGYNTREYRIDRDSTVEWGYRCNCQFYTMNEKKDEPKMCPHILALLISFDEDYERLLEMEEVS